MSVCLCGDVSVCEALKLVSSGVSVSATSFESVIPAGSAGGTAAGEMRLSVEIYTVGVSRGQRKSASWERPEELRRWRQKRKKPIRPQAGWYSVDMVLLLATAVDFEPRTDTWVPEDESLLERRVAN